ncbi:MAG: nicotinate-nucleotide--dimethylbenzimidazole phosphoribosyltransferase [Planctomycetes bacterium]|nr:nicotinate-nucleotide--dimethylbenzimidazole phosphoribosyltransferase [Planctomycetota bacterium]
MNVEARDAARARQGQLTKPPGSLGALEDVAVTLAGIQGVELPQSRPAAALIFASDHPVTCHGVSAYPPSVTSAMMANFAGGGAASTVFAANLGVSLSVFDVGVASSYPPSDFVRQSEIAGTAGDLRTEDALDREAFEAAWRSGAVAIEQLESDVRVVLFGEMGIGNTTPAAALSAALLGRPAIDLVGPGTGVEGEALENKRRVVQDALDRVGPLDPAAGLEALRRLGGRELVAIAGATTAAVERGMAVLVDGFIVTAAVLAAVRAKPEVRDGLLFAHRSMEPGHRTLLEDLEADALLDLGLRLGECSGALAALPLLDLACAMHAGMATFEEASIEGPVEEEAGS